MKFLVVGGGKIGLPLACQIASRGGNVTVGDIRPDVVEAITAGVAPFDEPGMSAILAANVERGRLTATLDITAAARESDGIIIVVPALITPDHDIDLGNLIAASRDVAKGLRQGVVVAYETTMAVGNTRNQLVPVLEESGLKAGSDFHVCFSPERVKSRHIFEFLGITPKVVGGIDEAAAAAGERMYRTYVSDTVINIGSLEAAEFVKLSGMVYRDVNIALANELATYAEAAGLDVWRVFAAANSDNETSMLFPGIGVGGHCTPVYPYFLIRDGERRDIPQHLVTLARAINESQPARAIERLSLALGGLATRKVHILGLGFRPDVKEHIYSPAFPLARQLVEAGAKVTLEDMLYRDDEIRAHGFTPATIADAAPEAIILNTAHASFAQPDFAAWRARGGRVVFDGRALWSRAEVEAAGLAYLCVGR